MSASTVRRTLIRSTPELWAEVSDAAALARHLGEFGDIRITRLDEEATVAWESELATGVVTLEASGLGTRVTLTAAPVAPPALEPPPPAKAAGPAPVFAQPRPAEAAEPAASLFAAPPPAVPPPPPPGPPAVARPRLFGRGRAERRRLLDRLRARPRVVEPVKRDEPPPPADPPASPIPLPVRPVRPAGPELEPAAGTPAEGAVPQPSFDRERATEVLTSVLDTLAAARHRPFGAT